MQKMHRAVLRLDIIGLVVVNWLIKLKQILLNNAKKFAPNMMDATGLHGETKQTQRDAGCYQLKETQKMKTMDVTKEQQDQKLAQVKR